MVASVAGASAAPTTTISFEPSKLGGPSSLRLRIADPESAGGLPDLITQALIHLPKGTELNLRGLPKRAVCDKDVAIGHTVSCPKESHAGPPGFVHWAAVFGGRRVERTIKLVPILSKYGLLLVGPITGPFEADMTLFPFPDGGSYAAQGLMLSTEGGWVYEAPSFSAVDSILELSLTIDGGVREPGGSRRPLIVEPSNCPRGGFSWVTDFRFWEGPEAAVAARSRC